MSTSIRGTVYLGHWEVRIPGIGWVQEEERTRHLRLPGGRQLERREIRRAYHHEVQRALARKRDRAGTGQYQWP